MSIDPVDFMSSGDPRHFNRYAYSYNDPINMIDPDGRKPDHIMDRQMAGVGQACASSAACGAVVEAGAGFTPLGPYMDFANAHANGASVGAAIGVAAKNAVNPLKKVKNVGKAAKAATERAKNIEKGVPEKMLGPSGKPK